MGVKTSIALYHFATDPCFSKFGTKEVGLEDITCHSLRLNSAAHCGFSQVHHCSQGSSPGWGWRREEEQSCLAGQWANA